MIQFECTVLSANSEHKKSEGVKYFSGEEIEKGIDTLKDCIVSKDSALGAGSQIGTVTDAWYEDGVGAKCIINIADNESIIKIEEDLVTIAPIITHDIPDYESDEDYYEITGIEFDRLHLAKGMEDAVPGINRKV